MIRCVAFIACVLFVLTSCSEVSLDQKMNRAEEYMGVGRASAALDLYQEVAESCPAYERCAEALLKMGDLHAYALNDQRAALEVYSTIVKYFPLREASRLARERRAIIFEQMKDYLGAIDEYAKLVQHFPTSERANWYLLRLGENYLATDNYEQARIELSGFIEANYVDSEIRQEALFAYAESYFLQGRLGLAEAAYRNLIDEYPDSKLVPEAQMKIATCQEERGFLGYATKTLKDARKEYPNREALDERLKAMRRRGKDKRPENIEDKK